MVTSAVAAAALLTVAIPASAHNGGPRAGCEGEKTFLEVDLRNYRVERDKVNTIKVVEVRAQGNTVLADTTFPANFRQRWDDFNPTVEHKFVITVKAWDDPDGSRGWSKEWTKETEACKEQPPSSQPSVPEQPPSSEQPPPSPSSSAPAPAPTTTTTSPAVGANANLAETGASIALPIGIGALLLVGGGVLLVVMRRRSRA